MIFIEVEDIGENFNKFIVTSQNINVWMQIIITVYIIVMKLKIVSINICLAIMCVMTLK